MLRRALEPTGALAIQLGIFFAPRFPSHEKRERGTQLHLVELNEIFGPYLAVSLEMVISEL